MDKRNFCILVNPNAHNGLALRMLKSVEKALAQLPLQFKTIITSDTDHAQQEAAAAIKRGEYLAVMGGDGTARAIASIVSELNGTLAFIPTGRGNDLIRSLHLPTDALAACQILAYGKEIKIDMGMVNEQVFLGICSLGFDSSVNALVSKVRLVRGKLVYLYSGLRTLLGWQPIQFKIMLDGNPITHTGYTVAVANSSTYGGGMQLAPIASLQDGMFDVVLIGKIPKWRMLLNVPRLFKGTHTAEPGFKMLRGRNIRIEAEEKYIVYADGDAISKPPAVIKIIPNALRVLV